MVNYIYKSVKTAKLEKLDKARSGAWIFAYDVSADDLKTLQRLGFDEDILDDALDYFEVPRFEYFEDVLYLFTRYPVEARAGELSTAPLMIAISDKYILTLSHKKPEFLDDFAHSRKDVFTTQRIKFLLLILENIVRLYDKSLMRVRKSLIRFLGKIENVSDEDLKEILRLETLLTDYISALAPTLYALKEMLLKKRAVSLHKDDVEILEDLLQDFSQEIDTARNVAKTAQNLRSAHEVIIGHQLNATMKTLAALTVILTIPTIVSGIFGMNTWLPTGDKPEAFVFIILLILAAASFIAYLFAKKRWL